MVNKIEKLRTAIASDDWREWKQAIPILGDLLRNPGDISISEASEVVERFCHPKTKWEVKLEMARSVVRLPTTWAAMVIGHLRKDANQYVRQAAKRSQRLLDQKSISEESEYPPPKEAEELVATLIKLGGNEAAKVVGEMQSNAHSLAMKEFAHELSHLIQRLSTPVNIISRRLGPEERDRIAEPMRDLRSGLKAMREFTKELRWLGDGMELSFSRMSADEAIRLAKESVKTVRGVKIRAPRVSDLQFDAAEERLVRALTNILKNAVEASPDSGTVVIDATRSSDEQEIVFRISDQGPGIDSGDHDDIFRMGRTNKRNDGHSGLGLYVARRVIVAEHGGLIHFEPGPDGTGTVFIIRIPVDAPKNKPNQL